MVDFVTQVLSQAETLAAQGQPQAAEKLYQAVLKKFPDNTAAREGLKSLQSSERQQFDRLMALYQAKKLPEAQDLGHQLVQKFPKNPVFPNLLGSIHLALGNPDDAVNWHRASLRLHPDYPEAHHNLSLALSKLGQTEEALASCDAALALRPRLEHTLFFSGHLLAQAGQYEKAAERFGNLLENNPRHAHATHHLAISLSALGRNEEAVAAYEQALDLRPDNAEIHFNLGNTYQAMNRSEDALSSYERTVTLKPDFTEAHFNRGRVLRDLKCHQEAIDSFRAAIRLRPELKEAHLNMGLALNALGRHDEAVKCYRSVLQVDSDNTAAHLNLGNSLVALRMYEEAIPHLKKALRLRPDMTGVYLPLGVAHSSLEQFDEAEAAFEKALEHEPANPDIYFSYSDYYEKRNMLDAFAAVVARALEHCPADDPRLVYRRAQLASRDGDDAQAESLLDSISPNDFPRWQRGKFAEMLGKICDRLGKYDKAFTQFGMVNEAASNLPINAHFKAERFIDDLEVLRNSWEGDTPLSPPPTEPDDRGANLVFLIGFPRSGTTLLDTILRSHPDITVIEERKMVSRMRRNLDGPVTVDTLNRLNTHALAGIRTVYFDELALYLDGADPKQGIVIDKLPLNIINAGLIHRVFPRAKFILALRHPCDCVLSCYMQNFVLNNAMANFLDLEQSAKAYDQTMRLWKAYTERLSLPVITNRYEDLVQDLRGSAEPVLDFIGAGWHENVENYRQTALERDLIRTPSYSQVTQELYTRASGRWENYRPQMEPVLPTLQPWVEYHGY